MFFRRAVMLVVALVLLAQHSAPARVDAAGGFFPLGVYGDDSSADETSIIASLGFDTVYHHPWSRSDLDALWSRGLSAIVWLGDHDRQTCEWSFSDQQLRDAIPDIAGHPAIVAYQLGDEPNYQRVGNCPDVVEQYRDRADLVKSLDPETPTYTVISILDGVESHPYQYWVGVVDIIGLDVYPCAHSWSECRFEQIAQAAAAAEADGVGRYWAVIQDFEDGWHRMPTPAEIEAQYEAWSQTKAEGLVVYHWEDSDIESNVAKQTKYLALNDRYGLAPDSFIDIGGSVHADAIEQLAAAAVTNGCNAPLGNRFCPDALVTRAQMATFLTRVLDLAIPSADYFDDDDGDIHEDSINAIAAAGITSGCGLNAFCPDDSLTREQMAAFLARALDLGGSAPDAFVDDEESQFERHINRLAREGVTSGCAPQRFCPLGDVTRAQMATFLVRAFLG